MRIWGKLWKENHLIRDTVAELPGSGTRTEKVIEGLHQICAALDLAEPIWLDVNIRDFQRVGKTRFRQDSFVEAIPFDYLEFQVIEEDSWMPA